MKRPMLLFLPLIVILSFLVLPGSAARAQSQAARIPLAGPFCQGTGCDGKFENGGNQACASIYSTFQTDAIYDSHGNFIGNFSLFVSPSRWCSSSWGGFIDLDSNIVVNLTGAVGNYNNKDQSGNMSSRAINHNQWSSTVMDEYTGERCISAWIYGTSGYGYAIAHKLIYGGSGC